MRKVFSLTSFVAALAVVALLSFSFTGSIFAQTTPTPTAGTETEATTEATAPPGAAPDPPGPPPPPAPPPPGGNPGPLAPPIVFVLLLAMLIGAVGFFSLAARRNAER